LGGLAAESVGKREGKWRRGVGEYEGVDAEAVSVFGEVGEGEIMGVWEQVRARGETTRVRDDKRALLVRDRGGTDLG
jgi:hypothetical protein